MLEFEHNQNLQVGDVVAIKDRITFFDSFEKIGIMGEVHVPRKLEIFVLLERKTKYNTQLFWKLWDSSRKKAVWAHSKPLTNVCLKIKNSS